MAQHFDTSVPNVARMYNVLLGGKDNFAADRAAVEKILAIEPQSMVAARQNRDFLRRTVRFLAGEMGIRQFLDVGSGLPTADNVHEIAQSVAPESRIVYVDNDPVVLSHARALLVSSPDGECAYVDSDLRDTGYIMTAAADTLDLGQPIAILLIAILHFVPDSADPFQIVRRLADAAPSGSYLVISHATSDHFSDDANKQKLDAVYSQTASGGVTPRRFAEIRNFFNELELIDPGVVDISAWRPVVQGSAHPSSRTLFYGGVARKL
jgi:S-adenosyl methyltransferase